MTTCFEPTVDLIVREEPFLRAVARRFVRCESDSDDLVQETLLRAYDARERFQPGTSVRAWMTTILRRQFLTGAIRAKRRGLQTDTDAGRPLDSAMGRTPTPCADPSPDAPAFDDGFDDAVKQALDRVPEVYRTTFLMAAVRGMSCEEIGHELRVPVGTVMSRIHRARERLRADLLRHRRLQQVVGTATAR